VTMSPACNGCCAGKALVPCRLLQTGAARNSARAMSSGCALVAFQPQYMAGCSAFKIFYAL